MLKVMPDKDDLTSMMGFGEEVNQFDDLTSQGTFFGKEDGQKEANFGNEQDDDSDSDRSQSKIIR